MRGDGEHTPDDGGVEVDLEHVDASASRPRRLMVPAAAVAALALIGGLVLRATGDDDATPAPTTTTIAEVSDAEFLAQMPTGPLDGKESYKLPVVARPQAGVTDGQVVTVLGKGFWPDERVGIVMCTAEAGLEGVDACDLGIGNGEFSDFSHVTYADANRDGFVIADVVVRRFVSTPFTGPVDCASAAERCLIAIGAVSDYDRSGGSFVGFVGAPPFPEPALVAEPAGPYADGQTVSVRASGLLAPRETQLLQCRDERCVVLHRGRVAPDGTFGADVVVRAVIPDGSGQDVACEGACVIRVDGIGVNGATSAPMPAPVPIVFLAPAVPASSALPPLTTGSFPPVLTTVPVGPVPPPPTSTTPPGLTLPPIATAPPSTDPPPTSSTEPPVTGSAPASTATTAPPTTGP